MKFKDFKEYFKKKPSVKSEKQRVLDQMSKLEVDCTNYEAKVQILERMSVIQEAEKGESCKKELIGGAISIIGILLITTFERENVITSKAISFIRKK